MGILTFPSFLILLHNSYFKPYLYLFSIIDMISIMLTFSRIIHKENSQLCILVFYIF